MVEYIVIHNGHENRFVDVGEAIAYAKCETYENKFNDTALIITRRTRNEHVHISNLSFFRWVIGEAFVIEDINI